MKVSDYAKRQGLTTAGVYWQIHHGLVPFYTKCGHYFIDETEIDVESLDKKTDSITLEALMKLFGMTDEDLLGYKTPGEEE